MAAGKTYDVSSDWAKRGWVDKAKYRDLYSKSINNNDEFWAEQAERIDWIKKWDRVSDWTYKSPVSIKWFENAKLNVCYNCVDRHLEKNADKVAFYWEPENPDRQALTITYKCLSENVNRWANLFRSEGVKKGDRVTIYMPMIPDAVYSMLACARIGAVHSVVFGGFSPDALAGRISDCDSEFLVTADEGWRAGKILHLKDNCDKAADLAPELKKMFVVRNTNGSVDWKQGRDIDATAMLQEMSTESPCEEMDAEDPLFILYTSGSTGKPKGVMHTGGGYLVYAAYTHEIVFDYKPDKIYWCAADIGWITGHSYIVYGPLANAATSVLFEGAPTYPDAGRMWAITDKFKVNTLYTAPTLIRALMGAGDEWVEKHSRQSLELLGSVGEPINPEAWQWYYDKVGNKRCPIVDTWWQTETGGIMITPLAGATRLKPGSATNPFFGNEPVVFESNGQILKGPGKGDLYLKRSWPGQMRTVYGDHKRFEETYFSQKPGYYFTGDECRVDEDGYYWITGRADDVLNVSGHRIGTAEVESALVAHPKVAESAVVGFKHDIKGIGIYAYVTLNSGVVGTDEIKSELMDRVKADIGSFAKPEFIQWAKGLPKTRSGKIMRRILRKIANNDYEALGDVSTLAEPHVVDDLIGHRLNR